MLISITSLEDSSISTAYNKKNPIITFISFSLLLRNSNQHAYLYFLIIQAVWPFPPKLGQGPICEVYGVLCLPWWQNCPVPLRPKSGAGPNLGAEDFEAAPEWGVAAFAELDVFADVAVAVFDLAVPVDTCLPPAETDLFAELLVVVEERPPPPLPPPPPEDLAPPPDDEPPRPIICMQDGETRVQWNFG